MKTIISDWIPPKHWDEYLGPEGPPKWPDKPYKGPQKPRKDPSETGI